MENNVLLSICIPTNGVVEWVVPVIESIYAQDVPFDLFEVVVTDNGESTDLQKAVEKFSYSNFHYYKTQSKGFTNQIDCFRMANGVYRKMLNHRSCLLPNSLNKMIEIVNKYKDTKPVLYFAEGKTSNETFVECNNIDEFFKSLSYYVSWSAGVGVWNTDLEKLDTSKADNMFPHLIYMLDENLSDKYVIWNEPYERMADDSGKGGYDVFHTFAVHYLDIIKDLLEKGRIKESSFLFMKKELYIYLRQLYLFEVLLPTKHTYILRNIKESMAVYYSKADYYKMILWSLVRYPLRRIGIVK